MMGQKKNSKNRPSYRIPFSSGKKQKNFERPALYDTADMMQLFKVCERTIQRWRQEKILPYKKIGGKIYYLFDEVQELLKRGPQ